jgi:dTDP-6-deoxy-L-talose 4-dehydrogenase (NAD+)
MKILVIGNGFLATSIIQQLETEGHEILIFSRRFNPEIKSQQIQGDVFRFEEFVKVLDWYPQVVIHTAWITKADVYRNDPINIRYSQFTTNLASIIAKSSIEHFIVLGTCAEYGSFTNLSAVSPKRSNSPSLYSQQKLDAFTSSREILHRSTVRFTWARIFYPYGPNQDRNRLIPHIIDLLKGQEEVALTDTTSVYDWITTRDIASAVSWIIHHELSTEIDVGTSVGFTNLEVLREIESLMQISKKSNGLFKHHLGHQELLVADPSSPLFTSGWTPRDNLHSGLEWLLSW